MSWVTRSIKREQRFLRAKRELQSGTNERTGKPLTTMQKRKRMGVVHAWWKSVRIVGYGNFYGERW